MCLTQWALSHKSFCFDFHQLLIQRTKRKTVQSHKKNQPQNALGIGTMSINRRASDGISAMALIFYCSLQMVLGAAFSPFFTGLSKSHSDTSYNVMALISSVRKLDAVWYALNWNRLWNNKTRSLALEKLLQKTQHPFLKISMVLAKSRFKHKPRDGAIDFTFLCTNITCTKHTSARVDMRFCKEDSNNCCTMHPCFILFRVQS